MWDEPVSIYAKADVHNTRNTREKCATTLLFNGGKVGYNKERKRKVAVVFGLTRHIKTKSF